MAAKVCAMLAIYDNRKTYGLLQQKFLGKSVELWAPGKADPVMYTPSFHVSSLNVVRASLLTLGIAIVQKRAYRFSRDPSGCHSRL
jgi:hypothetical protein